MSKELTLGFLGWGNMAKAMAMTMATVSGVKRIVFYSPSSTTKDTQGIVIAERLDSNKAVYEASDYVVLAFKPYQKDEALSFLHEGVEGRSASRPVVISVILGFDLKHLYHALSHTSVVRVMPNVAAAVGMSTTAVAFHRNFRGCDDRDMVRVLLRATGKIYEVKEELFPAFTGMAGSAPAFFMLAIDAMADAGVALGLERKMAIEVAANVVKGTGTLVVETGQHPKVLQDSVCSPGGCTIQGILQLHENGFPDAIHAAVTTVAEGAAATMDQDDDE